MKTKMLLISLRETPYNDILTNYKTYEYRKRFIREPSYCIVYVSSPIKAIKCIVKLGKPIEAEPEIIAEIARGEHEHWYDSTIKYLEGYKKGFAIPILEYIEIAELSLDTLRSDLGKFSPPQLYINLEKNQKLYKYFKDKGLLDL